MHFNKALATAITTGGEVRRVADGFRQKPASVLFRRPGISFCAGPRRYFKDLRAPIFWYAFC